jgi:hypothetical protein
MHPNNTQRHRMWRIENSIDWQVRDSGLPHQSGKKIGQSTRKNKLIRPAEAMRAVQDSSSSSRAGAKNQTKIPDEDRNHAPWAKSLKLIHSLGHSVSSLVWLEISFTATVSIGGGAVPRI